MAEFPNQYDFCPWQFWRMATQEERASQLAHQASLAATGKACFGEQSFMSPLAGFVPEQVEIGNGSYIAGYAYVTDRVRIGAHSTINPYAVVRGTVTAGNGVRIGAHANVLGFNHNHEDPDKPIYQQGVSARGIVIGDDVWIGSAATILDGVRIGSHVIVAANAVVTRDVPDYAVVAGNPARVLRDRRSPAKTNDLERQLCEFGARAAAQWPAVLARCEARHGDEPVYVDSPTQAARNVPHSIRGLNDAIEIAAAFGDVCPIQPKETLIARLQACQDETTGLPFDPLQPGAEIARSRPFSDGNTIYMVLSVGYALECLGAHFAHPLSVVHNMPAEELHSRLAALPWRSNAWGAGAWADSFGTALWMNRHHFGQDGFYRLTRGTYAHFGLPVPHPEAAADTVLAHIRLNRGFGDAGKPNYNACNLLDTVHPFWLLMQQTSHRRDEMLAFVRDQLPRMMARWVDGKGFSFAHTEDCGLQGTEMWLSVIYIAADALGLAGALGYSPKGVHWLRPPGE